MVFVLLPVALVDIAAMFLHDWGTQYYISIIDTLILAIIVCIF
jgi:hypothetical protein